MDTPVGPSSGLWKLLNIAAHPGWIGVQLFFALSGFLITIGLFETQGAAGYLRNFYAKRALRILPLYYSVLFAFLVVAPRVFALQVPITAAGQLPLWLFVTNWVHGIPFGFAHFWSLAVEEQFYLVWPFVVWQLAPRGLLTWCAGIAVLALLLRCILSVAGVDPWILYINTGCRMDALAAGAAAACIARDPALRLFVRRYSSLILASAGTLFIAGIPLTHLYDRYSVAGETFGYTFLALCSAALVLFVALAQPGQAIASTLGWRPLVSIGKYSYAIYVFHGILNKWFGESLLTRYFGGTPSAKVVFMYALTILGVSYLLGFTSYHLLEKHFLKLKSRLEPSVGLAPR
jgi:peptidoglycan/LPS O-acetylase OafA/YrhL